jgi:hypothetical protein
MKSKRLLPILMLGLVPLLSGCLSPAPRAPVPVSPAPPVPVRYLVYGDSLAVQMIPYLSSHGTVASEAYNGQAPCGLLNRLAPDAQAWAPTEVLIQFVGNPGCAPSTYPGDLTTMVQFWQVRGVRVRMLIDPIDVNGAYAWAQTVERSVAGATGIPVTDAGQAVLDHGAFTFFLPCATPQETSCGAEQPGMVRVRWPDGLHFDGLFTPVSEGAWRFANAAA